MIEIKDDKGNVIAKCYSYNRIEDWHKSNNCMSCVRLHKGCLVIEYVKKKDKEQYLKEFKGE